MDPHRFPQGGYFPQGDDDGADAWAQSGQDYEDLNTALLMHPETVIDDPTWYNFDYSADPSAYPWDVPGAELSYEPAAGPSEQHLPQQQHHHQQPEEPAGSSRNGKGRAPPPPPPQQQQQQQQVEYRFKTDLPDPSDCETYKSTIKELYLTQKLSLKDVTEIMKERHEFFAT